MLSRGLRTGLDPTGILSKAWDYSQTPDVGPIELQPGSFGIDRA